ncbi:ExbD/TolR family protein [Halotia branconii]|uniref:Biopolymer transporter ExbD n=1 Tax=Halotia branconii CENA392 TaxID=1539056 RepID=A0AAJ6NU56_9CYAN|nr:biopolymer transporter ExbD [Halotia branconii]WGV26463.1 biopolymer transporter ExbD [Halotia branconii CENA392]
MKVNLHSPIEEAQIQIIPLIDVVFCILTFFLLAALQFTRQQAINVDLPKASTSTAAGVTSQSSQIVTIDAVGNTYIEKQPVKREELAQRLKQYLQENPNGIVILNASRTATYNDVIETLDILRQVGGDRVSLGIIPGPSQLSPSLSNPLTDPYFPTNPVPNTAPLPGINSPGEIPVPQTEQGISPATPGIPNTATPQVPVAPENTNPTP